GSYGDALLELSDTVKACGFAVAGAAVFIAPHSVAPVVAAARPDASDRECIRGFAEKVRSKLEAAGMSLKEVRRNPFGRMKSAVENKKAALIGHMGYLEEAISQSCQMSVITDKPRDMGDYSAAAAEFILGEQDYVFADGKSVVSKKLPRLLELSDRVFLVGIGVPLGDALFSLKVFEQQGFCVADQPFCKRLISRGAPISELFQALLFTTNRRDKSCS
ncbi:MAG: hypothetical protein EOM14_07125, partial [Clostridia bacterium]|nr:hypothetical protein [Clostridia bacterium]